MAGVPDRSEAVMSVLRVYDPPECDERGVPLDWECCRCQAFAATDDASCPFCLDHGSLKAAARAAKETWTATPEHAACDGTGRLVQVWPQADGSGDIGDRCHCAIPELRCEDCGHPMSEGTWEAFCGEVGEVMLSDGTALVADEGAVHYSSCDVLCRHGGPGRTRVGTVWVATDCDPATGPAQHGSGVLQASWRSVDIRTLGWPMDLRPERLAVLCLRCYAAR